MSTPTVATSVIATAFGGPEVLSVVDVPLGAPGPGEVLIEVRAAGVNPIDWKLYGGLRGTNVDLLPMALGFEASGVITAVGADAVGATGALAVGDEVIGHPIVGAYSSHVISPATAFVPKPPTLTFPEAGAMMLAGATAVHALTATGVSPGETVLIHAASGGVGLLAVQIARERGARVIGTASESRHDELRALGVEPTRYGDGLLARVRALAPDGIDAAVDAAGTEEALAVSLTLVPDRRRIATVANYLGGFDAGIQVLGGGPGADPGTHIRAAARVELAELADAGKLALPTRTVPLASAAEAHLESIAGHAYGKVALVP